MLLFGGGGHAKVVMDCIWDAASNVSGVFDDNPQLVLPKGVQFLGRYNSDIGPQYPIIISVGNNKIRYEVVPVIRHRFGKAIHPSALVSAHSTIGDGSMVLQGSIVQTGTEIGRHVIVNTAASIDHDNYIGNFVHIGPKATLCGGVFVGEGTFIGAGATIINNIKIGKWCTIGAGAVVIKDLPDYSTAVGVPARILNK